MTPALAVDQFVVGIPDGELGSGEDEPAEHAHPAHVADVNDVSMGQQVGGHLRGQHDPDPFPGRIENRQELPQRRSHGGGQVGEAEIHVLVSHFRMVFGVCLELAVRVDRELADHAGHVHGIVGLAEDVVVPHDHDDRQIIRQNFRPDRVGAHPRHVRIDSRALEVSDGEEQDVGQDRDHQRSDEPSLSLRRRARRNLLGRRYGRVFRVGTVFFVFEGKAVFAARNHNAL